MAAGTPCGGWRRPYRHRGRRLRTCVPEPDRNDFTAARRGAKGLAMEGERRRPVIAVSRGTSGEAPGKPADEALAELAPT